MRLMGLMKRATAFMAITFVGAALALPGTAAAATRRTTFSLIPGSNCVRGSASDNATLTLAWRNAAGALKVKAEGIQANSWGAWEYCNGSILLELGDQLKVTVGSKVRRITVPNITFVIDRAADEFRGTAPAGSTIVFWYPTPSSRITSTRSSWLSNRTKPGHTSHRRTGTGSWAESAPICFGRSFLV